MSELKRVKDWNWHQKYLEQLDRAKEAEELNRKLIKFLKTGISKAWQGLPWFSGEVIYRAVELGLMDEREAEDMPGRIISYKENIKKAGGDL